MTRLVRIHNNLRLKAKFEEDEKPQPIPWQKEMTIRDPDSSEGEEEALEI